jgi:hypothetical protein
LNQIKCWKQRTNKCPPSSNSYPNTNLKKKKNTHFIEHNYMAFAITHSTKHDPKKNQYLNELNLVAK